jgi:hypothetical protein
MWNSNSGIHNKDELLNDEEKELAELFANEIVKRNLTAPAIFMMECFRPMNFVISQSMVFFSPMVKIIFNGAKYDKVQELLEKRGAIPYIIRLIEQLDEKKRG